MTEENTVPATRLKSVRITDFRRFTDLTVQSFSDTAKLIMLAGPNGCGKSSFFDALGAWHRTTCRQDQTWDIGYHRKVSSDKRERWSNDVRVEMHHELPAEEREKKKAFYFRSAYRNDPEFQVGQLKRTTDIVDQVRFRRMIENDAAVGQNYQRMASQGLEDVYSNEDPSTTIGEFREKTIGDVRDAMLRVFPDLELNSLGNPLTTGTFKFSKGDSDGFLFKNLSGGEKAVFDLILDLVVARREFNRTVFCIDEPESHMNSRLQAELLSVLYDLIPRGCQLILATHSIGMMRRAVDIERGAPGSVAFLDFGDKDFDKTVTIEPALPNRSFWQRAYEVALDDLASLIAPSQVIICEGSPTGVGTGKNAAHDARCYNQVFETEFPQARFISAGSATEVERDRLGLSEALRTLVDGLEIIRVVDRDDKSEGEIQDQMENGVKVLSRRNIEAYLFDDEVLRALADSTNQPEKATILIAEKQRLLSKSSGPINDVKKIAGPLYNFCRKELALIGYGNNAQAFMRDTLAPLIQMRMDVYNELRDSIFSN